MGNQQPKKLTKASKVQIDVACLKARIHLQIMRERKNAEAIKAEKQLVAKIKAKSRNRAEEILVSERVINSLKYIQACNMLIAYLTALKGQAQFLSDNMFNPLKIQPWLMQVYSVLYAADRLGLTSLNQFKAIMKALNDPLQQIKFVNPDLITLLNPCPTSRQLNIYILEMTQRTGITLEEINMIGHKYTKDPQGIPSIPSGFEDKILDASQKIIEQGNNQHYNPKPSPYNINPYQPIHNPYENPNNIPFNPNNIPFNPNNIPFNPNNIPFNPNNIPDNKNNINRSNQPDYIPYVPSNPGSNPYGNRESYNVPVKRPQVYIPEEKKKEEKNPNESRFSISDINQIDYYPDIEPVEPRKIPLVGGDEDFDKICDEIRKGL